MKNTVSNIWAANLLLFVIFLLRLPSLSVALRFFSIPLWPDRFSFFDQSFFANPKIIPDAIHYS